MFAVLMWQFFFTSGQLKLFLFSALEADDPAQNESRYFRHFQKSKFSDLPVLLHCCGFNYNNGFVLGQSSVPPADPDIPELNERKKQIYLRMEPRHQ